VRYGDQSRSDQRGQDNRNDNQDAQGGSDLNGGEEARSTQL
jgi:hypothetical protein